MTKANIERYGRPLSEAEKVLADALRENELTIEELIELRYGDDPNGGPLYARNCVWVALHNIRRKTGLPIKCRRVYRLE